MTLGSAAMALSLMPTATLFAATRSSGANVQESRLSLDLPAGRNVEVEAVAPKAGPKALGRLSVIVFSHGANAAPERYRALTAQWAQQGYLVLSPVHIDSELHPKRETQDRAKILKTRLEDMAAIIEGLDQGVLLPPDLKKRAARGAPIVAGHSYGAYIAQILGGATVIDPHDGTVIAHISASKIAAIIALSPPPAFDGFSPKGSWSSVSAPMLVQTGKHDVQPPFVSSWQQHLDSHFDAPKGRSWACVYSGADHYFGGVIGRVDPAASEASKTELNRFAELSLLFMAFAKTGEPSFDQHLKSLCDEVPAQ